MEEKKYCSMQLCEKCTRVACPLIDNGDEDNVEVEFPTDKDRSLSRLRHHAQTKEKSRFKEIKSYDAAHKVVQDKKNERKEKHEEKLEKKLKARRKVNQN